MSSTLAPLVTTRCRELSQRTGRPCNRYVELGERCRRHTVQRAARARLDQLVGPALEALAGILEDGGEPCLHCGRADSDRDPAVLAAAKLVLDRARIDRPDDEADLAGLTDAELAARARDLATTFDARARGAAIDTTAVRVEEVS